MHSDHIKSTSVFSWDVWGWIRKGSHKALQGHQLDPAWLKFLQTNLEQTAFCGPLTEFNILRIELAEFLDLNRRILNCPRAEDDQTCLSLAASGGQTGIVQILVEEYTVDVNVGRPLWWAARNGHTDVVEILLGSGEIQVNEERQTSSPLGIAAFRNEIAVMRILLRHKAIAVNAAYDGPGGDYTAGRTPLGMAASRGSLAAVELLLAEPLADVNAKDLRSRTALSLVAEAETHEEITQLLLDHPDINPTITDGDGRSALQYHTMAENLQAVHRIRQRLDTASEQTMTEWLRENDRKQESHRARVERAEGRWTVIQLVQDGKWDHLDRWIVPKAPLEVSGGADLNLRLC